jgi:hypothetical protein
VKALEYPVDDENDHAGDVGPPPPEHRVQDESSKMAATSAPSAAVTSPSSVKSLARAGPSDSKHLRRRMPPTRHSACSWMAQNTNEGNGEGSALLLLLGLERHCTPALGALMP